MNVIKKRSLTLASGDYLRKGNSTLFMTDKKTDCVGSFLKNMQLAESRNCSIC